MQGEGNKTHMEGIKMAREMLSTREEYGIASWKTVDADGTAHYWFSDNNDIIETAHLVDVWAVEWDENRAWVEDGQEIAE